MKTPKNSKRNETQYTAEHPSAMLQPHISIALETNHRSGTRPSLIDLSNNTVPPNKKIKQSSKSSRYGSTQGLPGPKANFDAPIVRDAPRAVSDYRQLLVNGRYNQIPDEWGVTNKNRMPMQNIVPTNGGKYSGRTGPIN